MAVRIDRVEREFILGTAAESKTPARLRAAGRSVNCHIALSEGAKLVFALPSGAPQYAPREIVSVCFDFRGQGVAFDAPISKVTASTLELNIPENMYRSLLRRWPRVRAPKDLSVEFLLPDADIKLDCPESEEWSNVDLPELREGLETRSLVALVESFKTRASRIASEGKVVMYKDKGPADVAEEIAARLGRVLYIPSTRAPIPQNDPYPAGRIVTRVMAEDFEGSFADPQGSRLATYLRERAVGGLVSGLWCPVIYYRYAVGMVIMSNGPERPNALDFGAVDLAWEFSRILAWFLKRHGYFVDESIDAGPLKGGVVDASPAGILAVLPDGSPEIEQGSVLRLRIWFKDKPIVCSGKVARRYDDGGDSYCGIAFMDLSPEDKSLLSIGLYGEDEGVPSSLGA